MSKKKLSRLQKKCFQIASFVLSKLCAKFKCNLISEIYFFRKFDMIKNNLKVCNIDGLKELNNII